MTPADLDLPIEFDTFDDFPGGNGFQDLPLASSQPHVMSAMPSQQPPPPQHTQHYPPPPAQPQQVVNLQQGEFTSLWDTLIAMSN